MTRLIILCSLSQVYSLALESKGVKGMSVERREEREEVVNQ
jgi:hypothetical protein